MVASFWSEIDNQKDTLAIYVIVIYQLFQIYIEYNKTKPKISFNVWYQYLKKLSSAVTKLNWNMTDIQESAELIYDLETLPLCKVS